MKKLSKFLFWSLLFAAAYTQSPLYTSNQNQYLLRGMAAAGVGFLSQDWLVSIPDTVPVFNSLVEWTYRIFNSGFIFYIYYALLMGVYLFSLLGIASRLFDVQQNRTRRWLFMALFITAHSAAIRYAFTLVRSSNWAYILEDGFAGQRMLGPVFEPSVFAVFLALSVYLYVQRRPIWAVLSAALAATIHPTYLLLAGLLTAGYLLGIYLEERKLKKPILIGILALAAVSPILIYSIANFWGSSPEAAAAAQKILVDFRIPHHADISQWFGKTDAVKILIILAGLLLVRRSRLFPVMLFVSLGSAAMILVQVATGSNTLALLFPWRATILLVPLAVTAIIASLVQWITRPHPRLRLQPGLLKVLPWLSVLLIAAVVMAGIARSVHDFELKNNAPEQALFNYISGHKNSGQNYLIPLKMQDFRLATGAPAYVDFKSIPYTDAAVPVWYSRVLMAGEFYQKPGCAHLLKFLDQNRVSNIVVNNDPQTNLNCPGVTQVYQDAYYKLYALDIPTFLNSQVK
jgi:hypothetical protein